MVELAFGQLAKCPGFHKFCPVLSECGAVTLHTIHCTGQGAWQVGEEPLGGLSLTADWLSQAVRSWLRIPCCNLVAGEGFYSGRSGANHIVGIDPDALPPAHIFSLSRRNTLFFLLSPGSETKRDWAVPPKLKSCQGPLGLRSPP